jgi:D-3-phosphoglycerate dehydrogenase
MTATATDVRTTRHTFKVLAADKLAKEGLEWVRSQPDADLTDRAGITEAELATIIGDYDAVIVRSGIRITAAVLENPGRLKVIARAGVGVDNIDLEAATARGILVVNAAEASTITTAEHAFTLMMALMRNIGPAHKTMVEGGWDRGRFQGRQLAGKTLGVVGLGRIGRTVAERALAFEMNVVAYDPFYNQETALDGKVRMFRAFRDMLPHVDIVTFHVPLNEHTQGMLNAETFPLAKKGLYVVNAARGGIVDEAALAEALHSGQCGGAAMDVFVEEPPAKDHPLRSAPRILLTPHLGASTEEAQLAVSLDAAASALAFLRGEGIRGAVNAGGVRVDLDPLQQRFVDLARRMAELISPMVTRGIADVSIELHDRRLTAASGTVERTVLIGLLRHYLETPLNVINVGRAAEQRGIKVRTSVVDESSAAMTVGPQLAIEIKGPPAAVTPDTPDADRKRRIVGRVYDDMRPRIVEINGYHMDMVPAGPMVLVQNEDRPGMIGLVGSEFGEGGVNIADMSISRRTASDGHATALMVIKVDQEPSPAVMNRLKARPGILKVATVRLPPEPS